MGYPPREHPPEEKRRVKLSPSKPQALASRKYSGVPDNKWFSDKDARPVTESIQLLSC